jgi:hypothetical protein
MNNIIQNYPKSWEEYKKWLRKKFESNYPKEAWPAPSDKLILTSIETVPITTVYFFDSKGLHGTYSYSCDVKEFTIYINGKIRIDHSPESFYFKDRKTAEAQLINTLFKDLEKQL